MSERSQKLFSSIFRVRYRVRVRRRIHRRKKTSVLSKKQYETHKESDRALIIERLMHFNSFYKLVYRRVFIKNSPSRWGSCSKAGNLNFNYRVVLLPNHLADYIIVHELCHIDQFNHSKKFWDLVGQTIPDYEKRRLELRKIGMK